MEVYVSVDNQSYKSKPERSEIIETRRRAAGNWGTCDISELADKVGNQGYAMIPAHLENGMKTKNCKEMQLFALDFDEGCTFEEIKNQCHCMDIPISFAYHTFSSTKEKEKFRVVFVYEQVVTDPFIISIIINMLHKIFPDSDPSCKNLDRMFLGGKELIYLNTDARISLVQLLSPFNDSLNLNGNYKRDIRKFCSKNNIAMFNDRAVMGLTSQMSVFAINDENMDSTIIHRIGETTDSSFFIVENREGHQSNTCKIKQKRIQLKNRQSCQLLNDFFTGSNLHHNQKFAILTNLLHVNGGQKMFFDTLEMFGYEDIYKWKKDVNYMKGYMPQRCSNEFCPYYDCCENAGTIIDTIANDRRIICNNEEYYSLEEATVQLQNNLEEAYGRIGSGIHLIKAQTAIGKTTAYINLIISHPETKFLVALPTNILKEQVYEDLCFKLSKGAVFMTASVLGSLLIPSEIRKAVTDAHERGIHNKTRKIVSEYYEEIKDDPYKKAVSEECLKIIEGLDAVDNERIIVTTHANLLQMPESVLKNYTIIIDEDILQLQFFNRINQVSITALQIISENKIPYYSEIAERMLRTEKNQYEKIYTIPNIEPLEEKQLDELGVSSDDNINDLMYAESYVKMWDPQTQNIVVKYFCPHKLVPMKYIILSATLNEKIYKKYFENRMDIYTYPEKKAKYKGELKQYTYHSLGRGDLLKKGKR